MFFFTLEEQHRTNLWGFQKGISPVFLSNWQMDLVFAKLLLHSISETRMVLKNITQSPKAIPHQGSLRHWRPLPLGPCFPHLFPLFCSSYTTDLHYSPLSLPLWSMQITTKRGLAGLLAPSSNGLIIQGWCCFSALCDVTKLQQILMDCRTQRMFCLDWFQPCFGWKVQMLYWEYLERSLQALQLTVWRRIKYIYSSPPGCNFLSVSFLSLAGVDFKMKTLLIDGIKVRIQIW